MASKSKPLTWQMIADKIWALSVDESTLVECSLEQAYRAVEYQRLKQPGCSKRFRFRQVGPRVRVTRWADRLDYDTDNWPVFGFKKFAGQNSDRWRLLKKLNAEYQSGNKQAALYDVVDYTRTHFVLQRLK